MIDLARYDWFIDERGERYQRVWLPAPGTGVLFFFVMRRA